MSILTPIAKDSMSTRRGIGMEPLPEGLRGDNNPVELPGEPTPRGASFIIEARRFISEADFNFGFGTNGGGAFFFGVFGADGP